MLLMFSVEWDDKLVNLLIGVVQAILIALLSTYIIKEKIIKLSKNGKNLNEYGIGNVKLESKLKAEAHTLFAGQKIRLCFMIGIGFFRVHKQYITEALQRGTVIEVILTKPDSRLLMESEKMLLEYRAIELGDNAVCASEQCEMKHKKALALIRELNEATKNGNKVQVRLCDTEYRMPIMLSYHEKQSKNEMVHENFKIYGWTTFNVPTRETASTVMMSGCIESERRHDFYVNEGDRTIAMKTNQNIIFDLEKYFEYMWENGEKVE